MWKQECQGATTNEYSCRRKNIDLTFRSINCGLRSMSECEVHLFFPLLRDLVRTSSSVERQNSSSAFEAGFSPYQFPRLRLLLRSQATGCERRRLSKHKVRLKRIYLPFTSTAG